MKGRVFVKKFVILLLAVLLVLGMTACSGGDQSLDKIKEKGTVVLAFDEGFPPMGFKDADGSYTGFDLDVAREVCKRLDLELKLQPIDWSMKEQELNTGNVDVLWNGFSITPEREKQILFSDPYMNNRQVLVVMADSAYQSAEDLKGLRLGIQAASSAADALDTEPEFKESMQVVEFDDNMMALMDLANKGVDCVLMDEIVANYYITKGDNYRVLDKELAREEFGVGFRKGDQALRDAFNKTMIEMAKDGTMTEISEEWFGKDLTTIGK